MPTRLHALTALVALTALAVAGAFTSASLARSLSARQAPTAHIARDCDVSGRERTFGPTYVTAISVGGTATCRQAAALVRAYYRCRVNNGGRRGHCGGANGFGCSERRFNVIRTQYDARVVCTRGHARVHHTYTQFT